MKKTTTILTVLCMSFLIFSCSKDDNTKPNNSSTKNEDEKATADFIFETGDTIHFESQSSPLPGGKHMMVLDNGLVDVGVTFNDGLDSKYSIIINLKSIEHGKGSYDFLPQAGFSDEKYVKNVNLTEYHVAGIEDSTITYYLTVRDPTSQSVPKEYMYGAFNVDVNAFKDTHIKGTFEGWVYNKAGDSILVKNGTFDTDLDKR